MSKAEGQLEREAKRSAGLAEKLDEAPRDRSDELLAEPPRGDHHLGRFAGYRAGRRVRLTIAVSLGLCGVTAVVLGWRYQSQLSEEARARDYAVHHPWSLPEGSDIESRPRTVAWTSGKARLALSREAPGAQRIELPDQIIELAPGHEHAQVRFEVREGVTVRFQVLSGEVVQRPRPPQ